MIMNVIDSEGKVHSGEEPTQTLLKQHSTNVPVDTELCSTLGI